MILNPNTLIHGVAPDLLVDCVRILRWQLDGFSKEDFCRALCATTEEAEPVLHGLIQDGYIALTESGRQDNKFSMTDKTGSLALATIGKGFSRTYASKLLQRVIEKAEEINGQPIRCTHLVECIVVFGSFLEHKPVLGDIDLGVSIKRRPLPDFSPSIQTQPRRHSANTLPDLADKIIFTHLRLRKPNQISVHPLDEVLDLKTPFKVVFGALPVSDCNTPETVANQGFSAIIQSLGHPSSSQLRFIAACLQVHRL